MVDEELKPFDEFSERLKMFAQGLAGEKHFGRLILGQATRNGNGPQPVKHFKVSDSRGLFLATFRVEGKGSLCGLVTDLRLTNGKLRVVLYGPRKITSVIPLEQLSRMDIHIPPSNCTYVIQAGLLVKLENCSAPLSPEENNNANSPSANPSGPRLVPE